MTYERCVKNPNVLSGMDVMYTLTVGAQDPDARPPLHTTVHLWVGVDSVWVGSVREWVWIVCVGG